MSVLIGFKCVMGLTTSKTCFIEAAMSGFHALFRRETEWLNNPFGASFGGVNRRSKSRDLNMSSMPDSSGKHDDLTSKLD